MVTNRSVLAIAIPMTLAYLTTPMLGLVDTAVVGQFGDAALLGGLAAGALIFDVVFTTFNFLRSGTTGLVAQAFGRGDVIEEQAVFWRAFAVALVSGLAIAVLAPLFGGSTREPGSGIATPLVPRCLGYSNEPLPDCTVVGASGSSMRRKSRHACSPAAPP